MKAGESSSPLFFFYLFKKGNTVRLLQSWERQTLLQSIRFTSHYNYVFHKTLSIHFSALAVLYNAIGNDIHMEKITNELIESNKIYQTLKNAAQAN